MVGAQGRSGGREALFQELRREGTRWSQLKVVSVTLATAHIAGMKWYLLVDFVCFSLMTSDVELSAY